MMYAIAADLVLIVHGLFIAWVAMGSMAVLYWPRLAVIHLPALVWGVYVSVSGRLCPLTPLEQWLRVSAGQRGYSGGFIDHYLVPLIYPDGLTRPAQTTIGLVLVAFNTGMYGLLIYRRRSAHEPHA